MSEPRKTATTNFLEVRTPGPLRDRRLCILRYTNVRVIILLLLCVLQQRMMLSMSSRRMERVLC